jgi:hypothetical protein
MNRYVLLGCAVLLITPAGCGNNQKIAKVSGVVTLNGKPYKGAVVSFQPIGDKETPNPGRGSSAVTDENGRYSLIYDGDKNTPGALIGKHRVRIFTQMGAEKGADDGVTPPVNPKKMAEPIPAEWHEQSTKEFDVPPKGTDKADFAIVAPEKN